MRIKKCPVGGAPDADRTGIDPLMGRGDVEKVRGGFTFTEGPVWIAPKGMLLFTDIPADTIHQLQPPATVTVFRMPSGKATGSGSTRRGGSSRASTTTGGCRAHWPTAPS